MQRNQILEHCKEPDNDGISIWHFPPDRKRPIFLTSTLKSVPNFDSNSTYIVISQKSRYTVLNDVPCNQYRVFFWVGSRSADYEKTFKETVILVSDLEEQVPGSRLRFYLEFQYSESFEFFSLFTRQDLSIERCISVSAIKYQDYLKLPPTRFVQFPKLLIFELLDNPSEYPHYYIRIYEKKVLESKIQSKNVYFRLLGNIMSDKGEILNDSQQIIKGDIVEHITQIDALFGSRVNYVLTQFVKRYLDNYRNKPGITINEEKQKGESLSNKVWLDVEDQSIYNTEVDKQWPLESPDINEDDSENYPHPYTVNTFEWKTKNEQEIEDTFDDQGNVKYKIQDEFGLLIKKQNPEFDPNKIQLFRISLNENNQRIQQYQMTHKSKFDEMEFKDRYLVTYQQLNLQQTDSSMLSSSHSYLLYTPLTIFLWHGALTDIYRRKGSVFLIKSFLQSFVNEQVNYQPSYLEQNQNINNIKFRIEVQYNESQRFRNLFKKSWNDDKIDYLMMGMIRNDQFAESSEEEEDLKEDEEGEDMFDRLANSKKSEVQSRMSDFSKGQVPTGNRLSQGLESKESFNENKKRTTTIITQLNVFGRRNTNLLKKFEVHKIEQSKKDQEKFLSLISGVYDPLSILSKPTVKKEFTFDNITVYKIEGSKFELIDDNWKLGIFEATKSYYVILSKVNTGLASSVHKFKHAIYLWRGNDQTSMTMTKALTRFQDTEFRSVAIESLESLGKRKSVNPDISSNLLLEESKTSDNQLILNPIISTKFAQANKIDQVKVQNMKPLIADSNAVINLRSIVLMDNEPLHFLEAFSGQMIISTGDYLNAGSEEGGSFRMMFQLIGVPSLNQKAREVPPIYESLTTSGLYVIITFNEVYFWIGSEFYNCYLEEGNYKQQERLISENLFKKILQLHHQEDENSFQFKREVNFVIEGDETKKFIALLKGKQLELEENEPTSYDEDLFDKPMIKFEAPFIKNMILPQSPRLFCLVYNSITVEYDIQRKEEQQQINQSETESIVFRELHNYTQRSLDQKGVFLLDFFSEAFIWVGKKVNDKDRLYILQLAYQTLLVLHDQGGKDQIEKMGISFIESGHEPEIFKTVFKDWQNFDHTVSNLQIEESESEESGTEEEKKDKESKKPIKIGPELVPENIWIN